MHRSPGKSGHTVIMSHCPHDCLAQMADGIAGTLFLYLGGVIKSFQSPWVLRSISLYRHRNKSPFLSADNYLPAYTLCTCMYICDLHVAKAARFPSDYVCKMSKESLTVAVPRLASNFSRRSRSPKAQEQPQGKR